MRFRRGRAAAALSFALVGLALHAQALGFDVSAPGVSSFRLGVFAYHRGMYAEAVRAFERSVSEGGSSTLARYWLGLSYYRTGYPTTAIRQWRLASETIPFSPFLASRIERLSTAFTPFYGKETWKTAATIGGIQKGSTVFFRPSSVFPLRTGGFIVVSFGTNDIVYLDINGTVRRRMEGPPGGLDRPYDVAILPDGAIAVSEFGGDRIALFDGNGAFIGRFGSKGRGPGQLLGPQNLASDEAGYLFVVDYGNASVSKFDRAGKFVTRFGTRVLDFPGFKDPTGIACDSTSVYVADRIAGCVYVFDHSGNHLSTLATGALDAPEDVEIRDRTLLVADTRSVKTVDIDSETVSVLHVSPPGSRIVDAAFLPDGNIAFCDFDRSTLEIAETVTASYQGLDIEIVAVDSTAFPELVVEVSARDRFGRPVPGLDRRNFFLAEAITGASTVTEAAGSYVEKTETLVPIVELKRFESGDAGPSAEVTIVVEGSSMAGTRLPEMRAALGSLLAATKAFSPRVVFAGLIPFDASSRNPDVTVANVSSFLSSPALRPEWSIDSALRLAVAGMNLTAPRRFVLFLCSGEETGTSLTGSTFSDMRAYLVANGVRFEVVRLSPGPLPAGIDYLMKETGSRSWYYLDPRGLSALEESIRSSPSGRYRFTFDSKAVPVTGAEYFKLAVECYLYTRSGKDELGYFIPPR